MPGLRFALLISAILWTIIIAMVDAALGWQLMRTLRMQLAIAPLSPPLVAPIVKLVLFIPAAAISN